MILHPRFGVPEAELESVDLCVLGIWHPRDRPAFRDPFCLWMFRLDSQGGFTSGHCLGTTASSEQNHVPEFFFPKVFQSFSM